MNRHLKAFISSGLSILPMIIIVILLSFISINGEKCLTLEGIDYLALFICAVVLILGLGLFQIGASKGLAKVGEYMGSSLSKQSKLFIVIAFSFLLGALITCAEPSILIVSTQVNINSVLLIAVIAIGVGIFVVFGVIRIISHKSLKLWYLFFYFLVFMLICLISINEDMAKYLPFIFDSGGITTGSATVPFILALGAGIAMVRGGKNSSEDSFGLVGMASIGPILSMTLLLMLNSSGFSDYEITLFEGFESTGTIFHELIINLVPHNGNLGTLIEVIMALAPIIVIFVIYNFIFIKLPRHELLQLVIGFTYSFVGLVIFLTGINAIMSPFGSLVGISLGNIDNNALIVFITFIIGLVTVLCEPAVHVLTTQIVEISNGAIKKPTVVASLSIGVGIAIALSTIRSIYGFSILYIIIPGYLLSVALMFICPNIYTAMAFDAGGTASGPMSVSFVLPLIIGITYKKHNYPLSSVAYYTDSFGVVALIALTPILTVQILGVINHLRSVSRLKTSIYAELDILDNEIIHF